MAKRRAKLFMLPQDDLYGAVFRSAHVKDSGSWANKSVQVLLQHGIYDWPEWAAMGRDFETYCSHVRDTLATKQAAVWAAAVAKPHFERPG